MGAPSMCFALAALTIIVLTIGGCDSSASGARALSESEIKAVLDNQTFQYEYRDVKYSGEGAVVAGAVRQGEHRSYFAIISGHPEIEGRVIPRQKLPGGGFQDHVDSRHGDGWKTKFVYTNSSTPKLTEAIDHAICVEATGDEEGCAI